jgi:hypothetical protein
VYIRNNLFSQNAPNSSGRAALITNWAAYKGETVIKYNTFHAITSLAVGLEPGHKNSALAARDNYWGTTDPAAIAAMILDQNDDASIPTKIPFQPALSSPHAQTPAIKK